MLYRFDSRATRLAHRLIAAGGILVFFALAVGAALDKSPTNDEPVHLLRGAALHQRGDLSFQFEHTPLSHRLIGMLFATEPSLPPLTELESWAGGDRLSIAAEFLWQSSVDVDRLLFIGRLAIIWTGAVLGAVLAFWTLAAVSPVEIAGRGEDSPHQTAALVVVMILYATSANLLAAAALATTDFIATVTYFSAICAWWFFGRRPGRFRWLLAGILLGLALAAKLTGVLLIPLLVILAYVYPPRRPWWRPAALALALLPVAGLVLWAVYGFQTGAWRGWLVPVPAYWTSWQSVLTHVAEGHQAFFLGERSSAGWWLYFPVTFLIKTPVVALVLLLGSLVLIARNRQLWPVAAFTLLPATAIIGAAMVSGLNIGYRHILPALPFLLVIIGLAVPAITAGKAGRWALGAAMIWVLVAAARQHPHHLAYFNELAGGSGAGYRYLGDSNLDWGQDLKSLATYADDFPGTLFVSYYGVGDPAYYGLDRPALVGPDGRGASWFHPANPAPGRYALSVAHWQGLLPDADLFDWFRQREPDANIGYSVLIYEIEAAQPGDWIAQCLAPGSLLADNAAEQLVGRSDVRHLVFDCDNALIFPNNGAPGWFILPARREPWWILEAITPQPARVYHHAANQFGPDYEVYYWPGVTTPATLLGETPTEPLIQGPAALWTYRHREDEWLTLWRVATATDEPLSIRAHLYSGKDDTQPQVADGLGYPANQWHPGDWFIQRHRFSRPGEILETGLYNYLTLEDAGPAARLLAH